MNNKPFGDCNVPGCRMGAMRGMTTCGMHKSSAVDYSAEVIRNDVEELLEGIRRAGYVVRVEQVPCEPLVMGNHRDVVTVYEVRK